MEGMHPPTHIFQNRITKIVGQMFDSLAGNVADSMKLENGGNSYFMDQNRWEMPNITPHIILPPNFAWGSLASRVWLVALKYEKEVENRKCKISNEIMKGKVQRLHCHIISLCIL